MTPELKQRTINTLEWMITDMKWRYDENRGNLDEGSEGGYSDTINEATDVLRELKESNG